jgi:hypothetical protein
MTTTVKASTKSRTSRKPATLAGIFTALVKSHDSTESIASGILDTIRTTKTTDLHHFDLLVTQAYAQNGWSQRMGRPVPGDVAAPAVIKVYVSTVRAAFRMHVDLSKCKDMAAVRQAVKDVRNAKPADKVEPALAGVTVTQPGHLTGALLHDLYAVRLALPEDAQLALDAQLQKLLSQYVKKAPPALRLVA